MLPDPRYSPFCWPYFYSWGYRPPGYFQWFPDSRASAPLLGHGGRVVPKQSDFVFLCIGDPRSYGILADGTLWGWGDSPLGDGTLDSQPVPIKISDGPWTCVATHGYSTIAAKQDGTLWSWGGNSWGDLGNGERWPYITRSPRVLLSSGISHVAMKKTPMVSEDLVLSGVSGEPFVEIVKSEEDDLGGGAVISADYYWSIAGMLVSAAQWEIDDGSEPSISVTSEIVPASLRVGFDYRLHSVTFPGGATVADDVEIVFDSGWAAVQNNGGGSFSVTQQGYYYDQKPSFRVVGRYSTAPTVTFERRAKGITVLSGGRYSTKNMIVSTPPTFSASVTLANLSVESCSVFSSGSGYTSKESNRLSARVVIPGAQPFGDAPLEYDLGEAVLVAGPVSSLKTSSYPEPISLFRVEAFSKSFAGPGGAMLPPIVNGNAVGAQNPPTATLEFPDGFSLPLGVEHHFGHHFIVSLDEPVVRYDARDAKIKVVFPGFSAPISLSPPPAELPLDERAQPGGGNIWEQPVPNDFGYATMPAGQVPYAPAGCWQKVDTLENPAVDVFAGASAVAAVPVGGVFYIDTGSGPVAIRPRLASPPAYNVAYGYSLSAQYAWPDHIRETQTFPESIQWESPPVNGNASDYPGMVAVYKHHAGEGFEVEWSFDSNSTLAIDISSPGDGYAVEPEVTLTSLQLTPAEVFTDGSVSSLAIIDGAAAVAVDGGAVFAWGSGPFSGGEWWPAPRAISQILSPSPKIQNRYAPVGWWNSTENCLQNTNGTMRVEGLELLDARIYFNGCPIAYAVYPLTINTPPPPYTREIFTGVDTLAAIDASPDFSGASKLFSENGTIYAIGDGHLWYIAGLAPPMPQSLSMTRDVAVPVFGPTAEFDVTWNWTLETYDVFLNIYARPFFVVGGGTFANLCTQYPMTVYACAFTSRQVDASGGWQEIAQIHPVPFNEWDVYVESGGQGYQQGGEITLRFSGGVFWAGVAAEEEAPPTLSVSSSSVGREIVKVTTTDKQIPEEDREIQEHVTETSNAFTNNLNRFYSMEFGGLCSDIVDIEKTTEDDIYPTTANWKHSRHTRVVTGQITKLYSSYGNVTDVEITFSYNAILGRIHSLNWPATAKLTFQNGGVVFSPVLGFPVGRILYENNVPKPPEVTVVSSTSGSGASFVVMPKFPSRKYPACLTQPFGETVGAGVGDANGSCFQSGGDLYLLDSQSVPVHEKIQKGGFSKLSAGGLGIATDGRAYQGGALRGLYSSPVPATVGNVEFILSDEGKDLRSLPLITVDQPSENVATAEAVFDGKLVGIGVISGGSGFTSAPPVLLDGEPSDAEAVISGPLFDVEVTEQGSGYAVPPKVVFAGAGTPASATCQIDGSGRVTSVALADAGMYRHPPAVSFEPVPVLGAIQVTSGGEYDLPPAVVVFGGSGSGGRATCKIDGAVYQVDVTNAGSGYTSPPAVEFIGDAETPATATASLNEDGAVIAINVAAGGSMYQSPPSVIITGGGGAGASARAKIKGPVDSVQVTGMGTGYYSPPLVRFSGHGEGAAATATTVLGLQNFSEAQATARIDGSILYCNATGESGYEAPPTVSVEATPENNLAVKAAVESGSGNVQDVIDGVSPTLEARIAGRIVDVTLTSAGNFYVTDESQGEPDWIPSPSQATCSIFGQYSSGDEIPFTATAGGQVSGSVDSQDLPQAEYLQKPKVFFANSMQIDVERVRGARRTAKSLRPIARGTQVLVGTGLYDYFAYDEGVSFTVESGGIDPEMANFWNPPGWSYWYSQSFLQTRSGKQFRIADIRFAAPPQFEVVDATGAGLSVSCEIDSEGKITNMGLTSQPISPYTDKIRIRLVNAEILRPVVEVACGISGGGVAFIGPVDGVFGLPKVVVYGDGTGAMAEVVSDPEGAIKSVVVTQAGEDYTSATACVYESMGNFMETEYAEAINLFLETSEASYIYFDYVYPEYTTFTPDDIEASATAESFLAKYSPSGISLDGQFVNFVDNYATCEAIETIACRFSPGFFAEDYEAPPAVVVEGPSGRTPEIQAAVVQWSDVFGQGGQPAATRSPS